MRAPLCSENTDLCPEEQGLIGSESENSCEIQAIEKSLEKNHSNKTAIFGICLDNLMGTTPQVAPQIPFILSRLCRYIEEHGLHCKHLFLETEERNLVESLKIEFIESGDAPLEAAGDVAAVTRLLIIFFEELPEPLIPVSAQPDFIEDMEKLSLNSDDCVSHLKRSVSKLPVSAYHILKYLSRFLLRVCSHKEHNGMNSENLGLIFGPVIFRLSSDNPLVLLSVKNVINYLVQDYHAIFEDDTKPIPLEDMGNSKQCSVLSDSKLRRQIPCPSSVMPVMSLLPLSVVIPSMDSNLQAQRAEVKGNVPVLLIEGQIDPLSKANGDKLSGTKSALYKVNTGTLVTRKRKERRLSGEELQQRSSSEERPQPAALVSLEKIELIRRCNSHEEMMEGLKASDVELVPLVTTKTMEKSGSQNVDSYLTGSLELIVNEKNRSPHPPNAKRREVEPHVCKSDLEFTPVPWRSSSHLRVSNKTLVSNDKTSMIEAKPIYDTEQNSIAEFKKQNTMDCDTSVNVKEDMDDNCHNGNNDDEEFLDSQKARIPRSASCPVPKAEDDGSSESESSSLSLSWSMLFESEDSEPMRSEHRYSWPMAKDVQSDDALLSPSVQSLRHSSYCEAPLSPSAYRSYLSYRSTHLDPSVPPSPPVEQEDFAKILVESNTVSDSIKQLTKRIHGIKKRIRKFDEKFETEFGYKPSHAEKANNPDAKKLMSDLYKARKELKALKEESHLEHVSSTTAWQPSSSHILGDTTNHVSKDKPKPTLEDSFGLTMKGLADDRKTANRPESVESMTKQQVKDEKFAIQRALLQFESMHGKPDSKNQRNTIRPLYDRYRSVKKLLVRSGSFPGAVSKKDVCTELQPILEHEAMDFTSLQPQVGMLEGNAKPDNTEITAEVESISNLPVNEDYKSTSSSHFLALKYDNSNIHELPLSEMIFQLQQVKSEKRHLRKILREFETEFLKLNGRKVQKEDKAPVDTLYGEYKHVKARLKLLEALISKHDQHQLM